MLSTRGSRNKVFATREDAIAPSVRDHVGSSRGSCNNFIVHSSTEQWIGRPMRQGSVVDIRRGHGVVTRNHIDPWRRHRWSDTALPRGEVCINLTNNGFLDLHSDVHVSVPTRRHQSDASTFSQMWTAICTDENRHWSPNEVAGTGLSGHAIKKNYGRGADGTERVPWTCCSKGSPNGRPGLRMWLANPSPARCIRVPHSAPSFQHFFVDQNEQHLFLM